VSGIIAVFANGRRPGDDWENYQSDSDNQFSSLIAIGDDYRHRYAFGRIRDSTGTATTAARAVINAGRQRSGS
jgi:hypothetical protein